MNKFQITKKVKVSACVVAILIAALLMYKYVPIIYTSISTKNKLKNADVADVIVIDNMDNGYRELLLSPIAAIEPIIIDEDNGEGIALSSVGEITITPSSQTDTGVALDSQFKIKTAIEIPEEELQECLSVKTGEVFSISHDENEDTTEFILSFDKPLENNKIYNIEYTIAGKRPLSFAFQTERGLELVSIFPKNQEKQSMYNVPVSTTIELIFSEELADNTEITKYVTVEETYGNGAIVTGKWEKSGNKYIFMPKALDYSANYIINIKSGLISQSGQVMTGEYKSEFSTVSKEQSKGYLDIYGNVYETFLPDDEVFVEVAVPPKMYDLDYKAELYEIKSDSDFADLLILSEKIYEPEYIRTSDSWWDSYYKSINYDREALMLPGGSSLIETLETPLFHINKDQYNAHQYVMLKKSLPEGYYAVVISVAYEGVEYKTVKLIQISPLAVYIDSIGEDIVVWVNDTSSGNIDKTAAQGVKISYGNSEAVTDKDGVAIFKPKIADNSNSLITLQYNESNPFYTLVKSHNAVEVPVEQRYYHYIYTDRLVYKTTDTIDIFGCIRPRMGYEPLGDNDTIFITFGDNWQYESLKNELYALPVELDEYGCFTIEMPITDYDGSTYIKLIANDEEINWAYCTFYDYEKPMYNFEISTDKFVYEIDEEINITATLTLFDNTPAADTECTVSLSAYNWKSAPLFQSVTAKTDETGTLRVSLRCVDDEEYESYIRNQFYLNYFNYLDASIEVKVTGVEKWSEGEYHQISIFPRDVMIETKAMEDTLDITLSKINFEGFDSYAKEHSNYYYTRSNDFYDAVRSVPYDTPVTVEVHKVYYTKELVQQNYNAIEKKTVNNYRSTKHDNIVGTGVYSTTNGKLFLKDLPMPPVYYSGDEIEEHVSYYLRVVINDTQGRPAYAEVEYKTGDGRRFMPSTIRKFRFESEDTELNECWYGYERDTKKLRVGSTIQLNPHDITKFDEIPEKMETGKSLCVVTQDKFLKALTSDNSAAVTLTMYEEWLPNVAVSGAYFDGRRIYPVNFLTDILYDSTERTLNISTEFDKENYKPGDEVTVKISVTDENGKGKKSNVNINAVDEAAIQAAGDWYDWYYNINFPEKYYSKKDFDLSRNRSIYVSYTQHEFNNPGDNAWGGGGGNDPIRTDFRDNPVFTTVETDENGNAEVRFILADSLTTWRITTHAVTQDDYIGRTKQFITTQLPLYVDIIMTNEFIEGDDISVYVRCFGTEYNPFDKKRVQYTIELRQDDTVKASDSATAAGSNTFSLGKLPKGEYIVKVTAKCGEYFDGIELPFRVVKSSVRLNLRAHEQLNKDKPNLNKYYVSSNPISLSVSNADMALIYKILSDSTYWATNRTDRYAANLFAKYYRNELKRNEKDEDNSENKPSYIAEFKKYLSSKNIYTTSGIPEFGYGNGYIQYSARFAACYPEFFEDDKGLEEYFSKQVYNNADYKNGFMTKIAPPNNSEDWLTRSCSYLGLAALGKSVLNEIYEDIAMFDEYIGDGDYYATECMTVLNYTAALCVLGDDTSAWDLINKYEPRIPDNAEVVAPPEAAAPAVFVPTLNPEKINQEDIEAMLLFINTTIDPKSALKYVKASKKNEDESNSLELIYFIKNYIPPGIGVHSAVNYTIDGIEEQEYLTNYDFALFTLSKEDFAEFNLTNTHGNTSVDISYIGTAENLNEKYKQIDIKRNITGDLKIGNKVEICYEITFPDEGMYVGWFTIYDRLPSGMRYQSLSAYNAYINKEKQYVNISFNLDKKSKSNRTFTVSYTAIVTGVGEFVYESAYIGSGFGTVNDGAIWGSTGRSTVTTVK